MSDMQAKCSAEAAVREERTRQDGKWGVQDHDMEWWLAILMEESGELAQAILETHFDNGPAGKAKGGVANIRKEAVQCAAVALAIVECIDRAAILQNRTLPRALSSGTPPATSCAFPRSTPGRT